MFLVEKYHYYKRFKQPVENNFTVNNNLVFSRKDYITSLNLPFFHVNTTGTLTLDNDVAFILLDNADITILGQVKTLIIEDISTQDIKVNITNTTKAKIIYINNPQTELAQEKTFVIDNLSQIDFYLTAISKKTFIKNNILVNLMENSLFNSHIFIKTEKQQVFDLTTEIVHKSSNTISNIYFTGLNKGKLVSQINSVVEKQSKDCELHQHIKHILFNDEATSYSKPGLMISSPCVASHGNSIGSIPEDWLFYLQTKGISPEACLAIIEKSLAKSFTDNIGLSFLEPILEFSHE